MTTTINDLPRDLLLHIFSFLPVRSAIQTCLVCHKWENLWFHIPILHFHFPVPVPAIQCPAADFINQTLLRRHPSPPLREFHVYFPFTDSFYSSSVDSWFRYAVIHEASDLLFDFSSNVQSPEDSLYSFPFSLLKKGNVQELKLVRCDLELVVPISSLKSLSLDQIDLTDDMVRGLVSGCVNLEFLSLEYCFGMTHVEIRSSKLQTLYFNFYTNEDVDSCIEICCPNLEDLQMIRCESQRYKLKVPRLMEANIYLLHNPEFYQPWSQVVRQLGHVPTLMLQNWWYKLEASEDVFSGGFSYNNVKHIKISTEYSKLDILGLATLLKHSLNVETMSLCYLQRRDHDETDSLPEEVLNRQIDFMAPNLKVVNIRELRAKEMAFLFKLLIDHAPFLEKLIVQNVVFKRGVDGGFCIEE